MPLEELRINHTQIMSEWSPRTQCDHIQIIDNLGLGVTTYG